MSDRFQDFVSEARDDARAIWNALARLEKKQLEWTALDYGNTAPAPIDAHAGITVAQVGAAVHDTTTAIRVLLAQGHATNIARLL